jgi:r-opsin
MHNMMNGVFLYLDRAVSIITMSWIWALGWSICPLVGWGAYAMDGIMGT